jgi:hypothetical protein
VAVLVKIKKIDKIITLTVLVVLASVFGVIGIQMNQFANSTEAPPQFCTADFINLDKIDKISVFRSFEGHDYSDSFEHNLSMKHYFNPYSNVESVEIYSPVQGSVANIHQEQNGVGYQVQIQVANSPGYAVIIFHLNVTDGLAVGNSVEAGQQIGTASAAQGTDIAISQTVFFSSKLYSYFDVMTDNVFAHYQARGATDRSEFVRSAQVAEEMSKTHYFNELPPLLEDWVTLNPT